MRGACGHAPQHRLLTVSRVPTARLRVCADERGFTLTELLVSMMLGLVVIGAAVGFFTTAIRSEPRVSDRTAQIQQARAFAERITRELRQGWGTPTATSSQLSILTSVQRTTCGGDTIGPAKPCRVTYTCTTAGCTRVVANVDGSGSGPTVQVVGPLSTQAVFSYSPSSTAPTYLGLHLVFPAEAGDDAVTVDDGVAFRNDNPAPSS